MTLLLSFWACTSQDIKIAEYNTAPDVSILAPVDNQEFGFGEMVTFQGQVGDLQDGPELLALKWSNTTGSLSVDGVADADGTVLFSTGELDLGDHTVTLRAVDTEGESNQASVQISIVEILEEPQISIRSPIDGDTLSYGEDISFVADIFDSNDAPRDLQVVVESNFDNVVCIATIREDTDVSGELIGVASCEAQLSANFHNLTYTVTDSDGMTSEDSINVLVESPDNDGDGFTVAQGDCDDNNASVNPQASESEYINNIDDDCDGFIDEGTEAFDDDGDGYTEQGGDCDDNNGNINPDMDETCADDLDTNCDGILGDLNGNADFCTPFYLDADGDGQGAVGSGSACMCEPGELNQYVAYTSPNTLDCHDGNPDVFNGQTDYFKDPYVEISGSLSFDYNCNGSETPAGIVPQSNLLPSYSFTYYTFGEYAECECDSNLDIDNENECSDIALYFIADMVLGANLNSGCELKNGNAGWVTEQPECGDSGEILLGTDSCVGDAGLASDYSWESLFGDPSNNYFCVAYPDIYFQACN